MIIKTIILKRLLYLEFKVMFQTTRRPPGPPGPQSGRKRPDQAITAGNRAGPIRLPSPFGTLSPTLVWLPPTHNCVLNTITQKSSKSPPAALT